MKMKPIVEKLLLHFPEITIADLQAAMREVKKRSGLCYVQGCSEKPVTGKTACQYHLDKNREYGKKFEGKTYIEALKKR